MMLLKTNQKGTEYIENESGEIVEKRCSKCGEMKGLSEFGKVKLGLGGKSSNCKECKNLHSKSYFEENRDKMLSKNKRWYEENRENRLAYHTQWREENADKMKKLNKRWYEENRENKLTQSSKWAKANPEKRSLYRQKRRMLFTSLPNTLTLEQTKQLWLQGCYLLPESDNQELEHFIPISWGTGGTTFENCYYMDKPLNRSKYNKNPFHWIKSQPEDIQERFHTLLVPELAERNGMTVEAFTAYVFEAYEAYLNNKKSEVFA